MCHMFTLYMMKNITMTLFAFSKSSPTLKHKDIGCWVKRKHKDIGCWVNNTTSSHENLQSLLPSRQPMTVTFRRAGLRCPPSYVLETGPQKFVPLRDVGAGWSAWKRERKAWQKKGEPAKNGDIMERMKKNAMKKWVSAVSNMQSSPRSMGFGVGFQQLRLNPPGPMVLQRSCGFRGEFHW